MTGQIYVNYTDRFMSRMTRWLPDKGKQGSFVSVLCSDLGVARKLETWIKNNKKDAKNVAVSKRPRRKIGWDTSVKKVTDFPLDIDGNAI